MEEITLTPNFAVTCEFLVNALELDYYENREARANAIHSLMEHVRYLASTDPDQLNEIMKRLLDKNV